MTNNAFLLFPVTLETEEPSAGGRDTQPAVAFFADYGSRRNRKHQTPDDPAEPFRLTFGSVRLLFCSAPRVVPSGKSFVFFRPPLERTNRRSPKALTRQSSSWVSPTVT